MKIGILGGSFNPIHLGHLIIGEYTREEFDLDIILFVVGYAPPHKASHTLLSPEKRMEMTGIAIESNPHFELCDIEFEENQSSYTVDVLKSLQKKYPEDTILYLIIGSDSLLEIKTWRNWRELWSWAKIVVIPRKGFSIADAPLDKEQEIFVSGCPQIEISSSDIRMRIIDKRSIRYLVPTEVQKYISDQKLYV
ncbi:nicotinate-nucleotide adenylyltransferase [bacterium]|nr:nicotinate-nucleotide adenylyltransferase [bacterium]